MSSHSPKATPFQKVTTRRDPLDIAPRPLSIPTLSYRRANASSVHGDVEARVRCEFVEMRGFSPTVQQAARLFQINPDECSRLLGRLVQEGFLRQTPDGRYRLPS
jgi:hypothetical protein